MNILPYEKQIAAISALTEGCSIRATERLTGIPRDTIMRLGVRVGQGCASLHDGLMNDLNVARIEMDEAWSYVAKKQRMVQSGDSNAVGDQTLLFLAYNQEKQGSIPARGTTKVGPSLREHRRPRITTPGIGPLSYDRSFIYSECEADFPDRNGPSRIVQG